MKRIVAGVTHTMVLWVAACSGPADDVTGPGGVTSGWSVVAPGSRHVCGLRAGKAYCWGVPTTGALGQPGSDGGVTAPVAVATDLTFVDLASGERHTCALTGAGAMYCWGQNARGQLGNGTEVESATPVPVAGGLSFTSVSLGDYHTCGLTSGGVAYCWGGGGIEIDGRDLAMGHQPVDACLTGGSYFSPRCTKTPRQVGGGVTFSKISAGLFHTCGLNSSGTAYCWGWNRGQLGIGETSQNGDPAGYDVPVVIEGGESFRWISAGNLHSCGVTTRGSALCWGGAPFNHGQLGNGAVEAELAPVPVPGVSGLTSVDATKENSIWALNTCALTAGGDAYCWGANGQGQLGTDVPMQQCTRSGEPIPCSHTPLPVEGGLRFASVATGLEFACGVTTDGDAYCWGLNTSGQLGNGVLVSSAVPTKVIDPT